MSRYRKAKLKITRRLGPLPYFTSKESKSMYRPGQHGAARKKLSQYAIRLEEKQKLRFNYGIGEKQLINYIRKAKRYKGATGSNLLMLLEMRLDSMIHRLGMAPTIAAARQLVSHNHIIVNKSRVSIASYQCKPGDIISVKDSKKSKTLVEEFLRMCFVPNAKSKTVRGGTPKSLRNKQVSIYLEKKLTREVGSYVSSSFFSLDVNDLFIIEFYSRKI